MGRSIARGGLTGIGAGIGQPLPDRFTLDKPGTCEVICQRMGREYKYREYCC